MSEEVKHEVEEEAPRVTNRMTISQPVETKPGEERARHTKHFAKGEEVTITFQNINYEVMTYPVDEPETPLQILRGCTGVFKPGRLTAILGPSGAGKTSLMDIVAQHKQNQFEHTGGPNNEVKKGVLYNGKELDQEKLSQISGYVLQHDVILETMTVREAVLMSAILRKPAVPGKTKAEDLKDKEGAVDDILNLMGLSHNSNSLIGSSTHKTISGGERKRVAICMEMITNPSILFLDEPTTGLDTFTAWKVIKQLKMLTRGQKTIVTTIHQPSTDIFNEFEDLMVVHQGKIVYYGVAKVDDGQGEIGGLAGYLSYCGFPVEPHFNPADWLFSEVLNVKHDEDRQDWKTEDEIKAHQKRVKDRQMVRCAALCTKFEQSEENKIMLDEINKSVEAQRGISEGTFKQKASFGVQFNLLARRAWFNIIRNPMLFTNRIMQVMILHLMLATIYYQLDNDQQSIDDREGALYFATINACVQSCISLIPVFHAEKQVFIREYTSNMYGLPAYFFSRTIVELPLKLLLPPLGAAISYWVCAFQEDFGKFMIFCVILIEMELIGMSMGLWASSSFDEVNAALAMMPLFVIIPSMFSGFTLALDSIPWPFLPICFVSPHRWGFVGLIKNEFKGLSLYCDDDEWTENEDGSKTCSTTTGEEVISDLDFDDAGSIFLCCFLLFILFFVFMALTYLCLWLSVRKHQA